jgi:DNA gyrase subunit A
LELLNAILVDPQAELRKRLAELVQKHGDDRRTELTNIDLTPKAKEDKEIINVEPEKCVVVMTEGGSIKRIAANSYRAQRRNTKGTKTQEDVTSAVIRTNTIDSLMVFTNQGQMYRLLVNDIPEGTNTSKGTPITALIEMAPKEKATVIYSIYRDTDAQYIVFATKRGLIKKTNLEEYIATKKKKGMPAISLRDDDELASVFLAKDETVIMLTKNGFGIQFALNEVSATGRNTQGVKGMNISEGDEVVCAIPVRDTTDSVATFTSVGSGKKFSLTELPIQKRGGKGVIVNKGDGTVRTGALVSDDDIILIIGEKSSVCISGSEIPNTTRTANGNILIKDSGIVSVSKV